MTRSGNKTSLSNYLTKAIPNANLPTEILQVIYGRAFLYQVKWCLYTKFSDIYKLYGIYLYSEFGYCYVVFNGSGNGHSTNDIQHIKKVAKHYLHIKYKMCKIPIRVFWMIKTTKPILLLDCVIIYLKMVSRSTSVL